MKHTNTHRRRIGFLLAIAVAAGLVLGTPMVAVAEDGERDVSDETARKVLKLLKSGQKAYKKEKYEKAYEKFEEAYGLWERAPIQARLGKAAEQMGDLKAAIGHYENYLEAKPDGKMSDEVQRRVESLRDKMVDVSLTSTPSGATVYLGSTTDGEELGKTPIETTLAPGTMTFTFESEGHETTSREVELEEGASKSMDVELPRTGDETDDEQPMAETEPSTPAPASGSAVPVATWGWVTGATGVAGLAAGGVFTFLQMQAAETAKTLDRSTSTRLQFRQEKQKALANHRRSLIAFSAGGALTAVGVGLLLNHYLSGSPGGTAALLDVDLRVGVAEGGGWAGFRAEF